MTNRAIAAHRNVVALRRIGPSLAEVNVVTVDGDRIFNVAFVNPTAGDFHPLRVGGGSAKSLRRVREFPKLCNDDVSWRPGNIIFDPLRG